jgi:hypothetical protein
MSPNGTSGASAGAKGIYRQESRAASLIRSIPGVLVGQAEASSKISDFPVYQALGPTHKG